LSEALDRHARLVRERELRRRAGTLRALTSDEREVVDELLRAVAEGTVGCLLEGAAADARLGAALAAIYEAPPPLRGSLEAAV
jgi:hypothetical protein